MIGQLIIVVMQLNCVRKLLIKKAEEAEMTAAEIDAKNKDS